MTGFLYDVWNDLRSKRLWPVAAGLVLAAVAVPLVLIKPMSDEQPATPTSQTPVEGVVANGLVPPTDQPEAGSSDLKAFKSKNPFKQAGAGIAEDEVDGGGSEGTSIDRGDEPGGGTDALGGVSTANSGEGLSGGGSPSSIGGASGAPASGGSTSGGSGGGGEVETRHFNYEVDVVYGETGSARAFDGLHVFDPLTERNPRLLYIGASARGDVASFSVLDEDLRDRGEGECVTARGRCSVLFLKTGQEHRFIDRDTDDEYKIRLVAINEVEFDK